MCCCFFSGHLGYPMHSNASQLHVCAWDGVRVFVWVNRSCWSFLRRLDPFVPFWYSRFALRLEFFSFFRKYTSITVWLQQSIHYRNTKSQKRNEEKRRWHWFVVDFVYYRHVVLFICLALDYFYETFSHYYNVLVPMLRPIWFEPSMTFHLEMKIVRSFVLSCMECVGSARLCTNGFHFMCQRVLRRLCDHTDGSKADWMIKYICRKPMYVQRVELVQRQRRRRQLFFTIAFFYTKWITEKLKKIYMCKSTS